MSPLLITTIPALRIHLAKLKKGGQIIGVVPTMGALHAGHAALMKRARRDCNSVVVTIFVNPTQFDSPDDYAAYAVDLARDLEFCKARNVDVVFAPALEEIYPSPNKTFIEVSGVSDHLCGEFRPGHFRGVATVVAKLFNIVTPDKAYFGEKDVQQLAVVRRLTADLNIPVEIVPVSTVREPDGLALSSRNQRLSAEERSIAPALFKALQLAQSKIEEGESVGRARKAAMDALQGIQVEYFEVVDAETMEPVERVFGPVRIAAAIWLGKTRLIDNVTACRRKPNPTPARPAPAP